MAPRDVSCVIEEVDLHSVLAAAEKSKNSFIVVRSPVDVFDLDWLTKDTFETMDSEPRRFLLPDPLPSSGTGSGIDVTWLLPGRDNGTSEAFSNIPETDGLTLPGPSLDPQALCSAEQATRGLFGLTV